MRLNHDSYQRYISSLNRQLKDKNLFSAILLNNETFLFPLEDDDRLSLVISLNHHQPLMYLQRDDKFYSSFENPSYLRIKKYLQNPLIHSIAMKDDDNIVILDLIVNDENYINKNFTMIIELIPMKPNLILIDENNKVIDSYYKDKNRSLVSGSEYQLPKQNGEIKGEEMANEKMFADHFINEVAIRRQERYQDFINFVNGKIKQGQKKIKAIKQDVLTANENLKYAQIADEILCLGLNVNKRQNEVEVDSEKIVLDPSKTIMENVEHFYKRAKKAKETIARSDANIHNAEEEIKNYDNLLTKFNNCDEKSADKLMNEIGMIKKKKEVKETIFNRPYKLNLNGTIIYFGRNASQNDYLSFVMKLDRDFTWMHIKDKSGAHLVIANKKPTDAELTFAAEIALICSHATSGEVIVATKKNVRRGHVLGEALLKNYSVIKINNVSKETKDAFLKAERL